MTGLQGGIPFSNSPRLHDRIGNVKTNKKDLAKSAFRNAEEFYIGAGLIFVQDIQLIQVVSVNLAFACELYLKAMLYELNVDFGRTHRIVELFRLLPEEYQKKIKANAHFKYDKEDNFHLILEHDFTTFIDDTLAAELTVLRHSLLFWILCCFRYFSRKWHKIPAGEFVR